MPVTINASPTNGLVQTADGSGIMKLQSNGVTTNALAWVNFNGTGTVAIRSSYNVSSITDNGTGDYTINFTTALTDTNFAASGICSSVSGNSPVVYDNSAVRARTTSTFSVRTMDASAFIDSVWISVNVFGN